VRVRQLENEKVRKSENENEKMRMRKLENEKMMSFEPQTQRIRLVEFLVFVVVLRSRLQRTLSILSLYLQRDRRETIREIIRQKLTI
jgi:hypothetical protein